MSNDVIKAQTSAVDFPTFSPGPTGVNATNFSDPVVWAAKLAYEKFVTQFGPDGARIVAAFQRLKVDLDSHPERGPWARRRTRVRRFLRGIWRVATARVYFYELGRGYKNVFRKAIAHAWGTRFYSYGADGVPQRDWDVVRDEFASEIARIEAALTAKGFNVQEIILHKQRLEFAAGTAPAKPKVNYGCRNEGFIAARDKHMALSENPYAPGTTEHYSWTKGWKQGVPSKPRD